MSKIKVTSLVDMVITLRNNKGEKKNLVGKKSISFDANDYPNWQQCCGIFMRSGKVTLEQVKAGKVSAPPKEESAESKKLKMVTGEENKAPKEEAVKKVAKKVAKKAAKKVAKKASKTGRSVKRTRKAE